MTEVMGVKFYAIFEPSYLRARISSGHAEKCYFVTQNILIVEVRRQNDFSALENICYKLKRKY